MIKDLTELVKADIITEDTAAKIRDYYRNKGGSPQKKLFVIFGILGALLIGLGISLIIAHNWDELPVFTKTIIAFFPLAIGQLVCGYTLLKKQDSMAWREGSSVFLFFAVGSCISMISQIYNIPGNLSGFMLTWMLLCIPLVYVIRSSMTSLLYIIGITVYAIEACYATYPQVESYLYWGLLLLVIPHYYIVFKKNPDGYFVAFHNWIMPASVIIILGTVATDQENLMFLAYVTLFGLFYLIGNSSTFRLQRHISNGYLILGSLGSIFMLLMLSFDWFWNNLYDHGLVFKNVIHSPEFYATTALIVAACYILFEQLRYRKVNHLNPLAFVFVIFLLAFLCGLLNPLLPIIMVNLIIFILGILTIREGARANHFGLLNYGLLIITALVVCRFFDADIRFVIRGLLFVFVGLGFFFANYWMLKKRSTHEK